MDDSLGLVGFLKWLHQKRLAISEQECNKVIDREMEEFCRDTAPKYGVERGINLLDLKDKLIEGYGYEELSMKNEEALEFLMSERQELMQRREAMFDRIHALPVEGIFAEDKSQMKIGRGSGVCEEGGYNNLLSEAEKYIENNGIDLPTEVYLQEIYHSTAFCINYIDKDIAILQKGIHGEEFVNQQLQLYQGKYKILQNIVLDSADSMGQTSEVDIYIITDKGLVVGEIKNYGNENQRLHISSDGRWVIEDVHSHNVLRRIDKSPVEQNTRHCLAVERLLKQEFGEECNIPIIPLIFIANNKVEVQNESKSDIIRVSEFYTFINSVTASEPISKEMQDKIEELLNRKNIGAQDFAVKSYKYMMTALENCERGFTQYVLYNNEVAQEYQKAKQRHRPGSDVGFIGLIAIVICYLLIFLIGWTPQFRIVLLVGYTLLLFNIPLGLIAAFLLFWILVA